VETRSWSYGFLRIPRREAGLRKERNPVERSVVGQVSTYDSWLVRAAAAIRVVDLRVVRGDAVVLPNLTCEVEAGSVTGLLGPSGSGKTTLMRAIVGVQRVLGGSVDVLGHPAGSADLRSRIGYMTQAPSVYGDLTVGENLVFFARVLDVPRAAVDRVLSEVSMEEFRGRLVNRLSGGQRARVSLAAALLAEPDLLVLDEPTVGLDPVLRRDLWELFHGLAERGTTLLVSSHVMDEADRCHSLLLLREGTLLAHATPAELRRRTGEENLEDVFLRLIEERA
jgi:ABC-2 type transport system ATP-binding protein